MRGMAHIGVLRAIETLGIHVDAIVGTSIGSLIGAMYAGSRSVTYIEEELPGLAKDDYFRLNFAKFLRKGIRAPSMYSGETLRRSLRKLLPVETFAELGMPFFCNAVCLENGAPVFFGARGFHDVPLEDAVYGSCALLRSSSRSCGRAGTSWTVGSRMRCRFASRRCCAPSGSSRST